MTNAHPSLASRLRLLAEDFASMRDRPSAEIALAAENRLRGLAEDVATLETQCKAIKARNEVLDRMLADADQPAGWDVRGYQPRDERNELSDALRELAENMEPYHAKQLERAAELLVGRLPGEEKP